ncbi:MAG: hypothetical protein IPH16_07120 [Haliscomenobacter sp.]|nr:hypothetical protein [Haliscomenobacter sp.]
MTSAKKQPIFIPHNGRFVPAIPEKPKRVGVMLNPSYFMRKENSFGSFDGLFHY